MSVSIWFETFNQSIQIQSDIVGTIASRYKRITKQLNMDFWSTESETSHSFYVGSYGRDTDIHVSDIDFVFELPASEYIKYNNYTRNGQSALLQAVKTQLKKPTIQR